MNSVVLRKEGKFKGVLKKVEKLESKEEFTVDRSRYWRLLFEAYDDEGNYLGNVDCLVGNDSDRSLVFKQVLDCFEFDDAINKEAIIEVKVKNGKYYNVSKIFPATNPSSEEKSKRYESKANRNENHKKQLSDRLHEWLQGQLNQASSSETADRKFNSPAEGKPENKATHEEILKTIEEIDPNDLPF